MIQKVVGNVIVETKEHICEYHKNNHGKQYAGCTYGFTIASRLDKEVKDETKPFNECF